MTDALLMGVIHGEHCLHYIPSSRNRRGGRRWTKEGDGGTEQSIPLGAILTDMRATKENVAALVRWGHTEDNKDILRRGSFVKSDFKNAWNLTFSLFFIPKLWILIKGWMMSFWIFVWLYSPLGSRYFIISIQARVFLFFFFSFVSFLWRMLQHPSSLTSTAFNWILLIPQYLNKGMKEEK